MKTAIVLLVIALLAHCVSSAKMEESVTIAPASALATAKLLLNQVVDVAEENMKLFHDLKCKVSALDSFAKLAEEISKGPIWLTSQEVHAMLMGQLSNYVSPYVTDTVNPVMKGLGLKNEELESEYARYNGRYHRLESDITEFSEPVGQKKAENLIQALKKLLQDHVDQRTTLKNSLIDFERITKNVIYRGHRRFLVEYEDYKKNLENEKRCVEAALRPLRRREAQKKQHGKTDKENQGESESENEIKSFKMPSLTVGRHQDTPRKAVGGVKRSVQDALGELNPAADEQYLTPPLTCPPSPKKKRKIVLADSESNSPKGVQIDMTCDEVYNWDLLY